MKTLTNENFEQYGIIDVEEVVVNEKGTDSWIK